MGFFRTLRLVFSAAFNVGLADLPSASLLLSVLSLTRLLEGIIFASLFFVLSRSGSAPFKLLEAAVFCVRLVAFQVVADALGVEFLVEADADDFLVIEYSFDVLAHVLLGFLNQSVLRLGKLDNFFVRVAVFFS